MEYNSSLPENNVEADAMLQEALEKIALAREYCEGSEFDLAVAETKDAFLLIKSAASLMEYAPSSGAKATYAQYMRLSSSIDEMAAINCNLEANGIESQFLGEFLGYAYGALETAQDHLTNGEASKARAVLNELHVQRDGVAQAIRTQAQERINAIQAKEFVGRIPEFMEKAYGLIEEAENAGIDTQKANMLAQTCRNQLGISIFNYQNGKKVLSLSHIRNAMKATYLLSGELKEIRNELMEQE